MAPLQGPVTLDRVSAAKADDVDAVASAIQQALKDVPASSDGWERLDYSRSPFQKFENIRRIDEFEKNLRLMMLSQTESQYGLKRFVPYPGQRRGFAIDKNWENSFSLSTPFSEIAIAVVRALADDTWETR